MFREGVQVAEAVIRVRKALATGNLSPDLAKRCETLLDERARRYCKATLSRKRAGDLYNWKVLEAVGWQDYGKRLFALASEVSKGGAQ